jgi:glycosyltransferase involved in cell wall biosynthesis
MLRRTDTRRGSEMHTERRSRRSKSCVHITTISDTLAFLSGYAKFMTQQGYSVWLVAGPGRLQPPKGFKHREIRHLTRGISPLRDVLAFVSLLRTLAEIRADIVHCHTPKAGLLGTIAARLLRTSRVIYHVHGLPFTTAVGYRRFLLLWSERIACLAAHQVLTVSESVKRRLEQHRITRAGSVMVPHNGSIGGVDSDRFHPKRKDDLNWAFRTRHKLALEVPIVAFVGRVAVDKGVLDLLGAWPLVIASVPAAVLVIMGPPEDAAREVARISASSTTVRVLATSLQPEELYAAARVLCLPSKREGFPVTVLEAAAMTVPTVTYDVDGCRDAVIEGCTGRLVPVGDRNSLATALISYLTDADLALTHGKEARSRVMAHFRPEDLWVETIRTYLTEGSEQRA